MAKIGSAIDSHTIAKKLKKIISQVPNQPALCARFTTKIMKPRRPDIITQSLMMGDAAKSWKSLSAWKKYRWSLCAWRKGVASDPATGFTGWSGMALYYQCYNDQSVTTGKQPVSPCSARRTDPGASPWNYLP